MTEVVTDGQFYCMNCGKANDYWENYCEECDMNVNFMGGDNGD